MSDSILYGILLIVLGIFNGGLSIKILKDAAFAQNYIEKSHKAWLWRKLFGPEKALHILRRYFAPFGIFLGIVFILAGVYFLIMGNLSA